MSRRVTWRAMAVLGVWLLAGSSEAAPQAKPAMEDLAAGKPATCSTSQSDDKRAGAAFDGEPESRWCASDGSVPQWLQVDLGKPETLTGCHIAWEAEDGLYHYKVEGSPDGQSWTTLVDQTKAPNKDRAFTFDAKGIRHVRLTTTETPEGQWASVFTFEVFGTRPAQAIARAKRRDDSSILRQIKAPKGFDVSVFAAPPDVRYPTCLSAAPTGEVYVGIDENGSLDAKPGRGRVVKCVDSDGDGKADQFTTFASMDSPRGVIWDAGTLYVLHPPMLTAYTDTNNDGVADKSEVLVKGIGFDLKFRGADHTTNGIRLGIDGYIYVAVGDYGFIKAEGKDGASHQLLGGGVVRVRTDGSGLESVSRGQRNIYDVAIDPQMNLFTRDNTNDGDGWDVRLSHVVPTGNYGYPSLYKRFGDEHIQPLADYGGGSPCGSLFLQEPTLPAPFGDTLYTCEWGRGAIFMHPLEANGAGFKAKQETFLDIPRPTDMDVDGQGHIYVSSWRDGGFNYSRPDIGYVIRVVPKTEGKVASFPDVAASTDEQLVGHVGSPSAVLRLASQRELLRRGLKPASIKALTAMATADGSPIAARVAAIFTIGQGARSRSLLMQIAKDSTTVREFAIKALSDRREDSTKEEALMITGYLNDPNPRVRLQAVVALGRIGKADAPAVVLPMTADPDPLVAHVAVKALVALDGVDSVNVCLKAIGDRSTPPKVVEGAGRALQEMTDFRAVTGLTKLLETKGELPNRRAILKTLCRLCFREAPYEGQWWSTRPDSTGPLYKAVEWQGTPKVRQALRSALMASDTAEASWLLSEAIKNKIDPEESTPLALKLAGQDPALKASLVDFFSGRPKLSLDAIKFLEGIATADADTVARAKSLRALIRHQGQQEAKEAGLRGLAAVAEADEPGAELVGTWLDYAKDGRHAQNVATFAKMAEGSEPGKSVLGFGVLIQVEGNAKAPSGSREDAKKAIDQAWTKPESSGHLLRAIGLAKANAYASDVRKLMAEGPPEVRSAAEFAARRLNLTTKAEMTAKPGKPIATIAYDQVLAAVLKDKGDATLGAQLFEKQGCINCHTVLKSEAIKGPYLGDITTRYNRTELTEAILKPSAKIAQGFETQKLALDTGQSYEGFVVKESGDELELRNSSGAVTVIPKKSIEERGKSELSIMPNGLLDPLTPHDLASILAYLESLKGK